MNLFFVTARRISPNKGVDLPSPKILQINQSMISKILNNTKRSGCVIKLDSPSRKGSSKIEVYENMLQVNVAAEPVTGTNPVSTSESNLAVSAAGTTQGTATLLTLYLNKVTTATPGTNDGVVLPTAAIGGKPIVVINGTAGAIKVYPPAGASIDGAAANAAVTLQAGERAVFVPTALLTYKRAVN